MEDCSYSAVWWTAFSPVLVPLLITVILIMANMLVLVSGRMKSILSPQGRKFTIFLCLLLGFVAVFMVGKTAWVAHSSTKLPCTEFYRHWHAARSRLPW